MNKLNDNYKMIHQYKQTIANVKLKNNNIKETFYYRRVFESEKEAINFLIKNNLLFSEIKDRKSLHKKIFLHYNGSFWSFCNKSRNFYKVNFHLSSHDKNILIEILKNSRSHSNYEKDILFCIQQYIFATLFDE